MTTRVGIIRCEVQTRTCAGWGCFSAIRNKTGQFKRYDEVELIGFDTCGGCERGSPDKIVSRAQRLKEKGAEVVHFSSCVVGECPFEETFAQAIEGKAGIPIIRGTHPKRALTVTRKDSQSA